MTEYDYSPDAVERYLAKQARIADWVDQTNRHEPANPFVPLPSETERAYLQRELPAPSYPYGYLQSQPQPQPAYYTNPQGVISPTYSSSSKRHHDRHHHHHHHHHRDGSHHSNGTKSLRPSPKTASSALPMGTGLVYAPTPQRSVSTPPSTVQGMMVPVAMTSPNAYIAYPAQQQQLYQPLVSPPMAQQPQVQGYPFPYVAPPQAMMPSQSYSSAHSHHSYSQSYSRPTSSQYAYSQSPPLQSPPYPQVYQSPSHQPLVVPINGGSNGYVVVPAGRSVQVLPQPTNYAHSDYEFVERPSDSESDTESSHGAPSFLGSLKFKKSGMGLRGRKSRRKERRGSHSSSC